MTLDRLRGPRKAGVFQSLAAIAIVVSVSCGDSTPAPSPLPPPPAPPPPNNVPVVQSIAVQGTRPRQPAGFADLNEIVNVTAQVRDDETAVEQLQYTWSATAGTFTGSGARVTWQAPATATTPATVTLTLQVVERYGTNFEHRVTSTATVALHDSVREVGAMARQFLLDFSNTSDANVSRAMENFGSVAICRDNAAQREREDVINHFENFRMIRFDIGNPSVRIDFGRRCPSRVTERDACVTVPVFWESMRLATGQVGAVRGEDEISATYSTNDRRWWLCSSDFDGDTVSGARLEFYLRR
jgi:hypothetical protein